MALEDASGQVVTASTAIVVLSLSSGAMLTGTLQQAAVNGVATFDNLSLQKAGSYTLAASAVGPTKATSTAFSVTAGPPTQVVFGVPVLAGPPGRRSRRPSR